MSGDIVGCHNCVWRSPAPSGWGPGLLLNTLPYKAPGPKVHEPRGCRTLGWVESASAPLWFRVCTVVARPAVFTPLVHQQLQLIENL